MNNNIVYRIYNFFKDPKKTNKILEDDPFFYRSFVFLNLFSAKYEKQQQQAVYRGK